MRLLVLIILCCEIYNGLGFQLSGANIVPRGGISAGGSLSKKPVLTAELPPKPTATALTSVTSADSGEWTKKRLHNTKWFRSAAILLTLSLAGASQKSPLALLPTQAGAAIHLLSFGTCFGTMFYTTFIFGITAFRNLPRQTFGKLQSKLFPKYFSLCSITILLQVRRICVPLKVLDWQNLSHDTF
jgi:hypothetical protein